MKQIKDRFTGRAVATLAGAAAGNFISSQPVLIGTFGVFLLPVSESIGWSRTRFSALLLLLSVLGLAGFPLAGRLADRWNARTVLIVGNLLFAAAVWGFSALSDSYVVTTALFAAASLAGCLSSTVVLNKLLAEHFDKHQGLAFGLTAGAGASLGYVLLPPIAQQIIIDSNWQNAYRALALLILVIGQLSFWFLIAPVSSRSPVAPAALTPGGASARQALASPIFWLILTAMCVASISISAIVAHTVAMAADRSVAPQIAVLMMSAGAAANAVWQVVSGAVLDRVRRPRFIAPFVLVAILGLYTITTASSAGAFVLAGISVGIASGSEWGFVPIALRRYFGDRAFAEIYGLVFAVAIVSHTAGPMMLAATYDLTGSYAVGIRVMGVAFGLAAAIIFFLPRFGEVEVARNGPLQEARARSEL